MARGWESKSVEDQMVEKGTLSIASNVEQKRVVQRTAAALQRERQALELQRENILSQKTSNPVRRQALEAALQHIESQLAALD